MNFDDRFALGELADALVNEGKPPGAWIESPSPDDDLRRAWLACTDPGVLYRVGGPFVDRVALVRALLACVALVESSLPADEPAPHATLDATRRWCEGKATVAEVDATLRALDATRDRYAGQLDAYAAVNMVGGPASVVLARASQRAPTRAVAILNGVPGQADVLRGHLQCPTFAELVAYGEQTYAENS